MNVCCFCEEWGDGGIESFLLNILEHMNLSRIELDIIVARKKSEFYMPRIHALGVGFIELSGDSRRLWKNHTEFRKIICTKQYDIVYLNIYQALSLLYARDAKMTGVTMRIAHSHNNGLRKSVTKPLKMMMHNISKKLFTRYVTEYWACSESAAHFMFQRSSDYLYVPNGIEIERFAFRPERREQFRRNMGIEQRLVVGNVGRLCYQKNQEFLLKVICELRQNRPNVLLMLVGDGEDQVRLKNEARNLGVEDCVVFFGTTDDVPLVLWAMDVFAFPSRFEGLGIAAIEAQAAGLPVLCSDNVPPEAGIKGFAEFLPLSAGAKVWAERLYRMSDDKRRDSTEMITRAGYDITTVACMIQNTWLTAEKNRAIGENS
jgi:glycosyltransferase involved in cell wall biosynthesis